MLNLNNFYKNGFDSFFIDGDLKKKLWSLIKKENWIEPTMNLKELCDNDGYYKKIPEWMDVDLDNYPDTATKQENFLEQKWKEKRPKSYSSIFKFMLHNTMYNGYLTEFYKLEIDSIQLWSGVGSYKWHWDGPGNQDLFFLIYLSEFDKWDETLGGGISAGIRELTNTEIWSNISPSDEEVDLLGTFYPDNGRILYGNNMNPRFVHKPIAFTDKEKEMDINRYTFLVTVKLEKKY